ncbi:UDP-forming cellulose synthase catalytic subunit, partial [Klebsiella pneumoniae]
MRYLLQSLWLLTTRVPEPEKKVNWRYGASWLSASLGCLWASLVWALMPLETPRWQAILARHETYFPHINPHRPRPLDPLRYLLQSLWLLTTRVPEPEKKVNWR